MQDAVYHPLWKERVVFRESTEDVFAIDIYIEAGGDPRGPQHVHPLRDERVRLVTGSARLLLDREEREPFHERAREQARAPAHWSPAGAVYPHTLHAAARRVLLEDVAAQIPPGELRDAGAGVASHGVGVVGIHMSNDAGGRRT